MGLEAATCLHREGADDGARVVFEDSYSLSFRFYAVRFPILSSHHIFCIPILSPASPTCLLPPQPVSCLPTLSTRSFQHCKQSHNGMRMPVG